MTRVRWPVRLHFRRFARPGWSFLVGGTSESGCFVTQLDDHGRVWLTRLWFIGPLAISLDLHVPWAAAESIGRQSDRREFRGLRGGTERDLRQQLAASRADVRALLARLAERGDPDAAALLRAGEWPGEDPAP